MHLTHPLLTGLLLAAGTYGLSLQLGAALARVAGKAAVLPTPPWRQPALLRAFGLFSLLLMGCTGSAGWRQFGFQPAAQPWGRFVLSGVCLGAGVALVLKLGSRQGMDAALKGLAPPAILLMALYSTGVEELFTRGWLQGFLEPWGGRSVPVFGWSPSVPVLASTLVFAAMHLTLIGKGVDAWSAAIILAFTAGAGLLAALARDQTGSLLPAVWTHLSGNLGGVLGGIVFALVHRIRHGRLPEL